MFYEVFGYAAANRRMLSVALFSRDYGTYTTAWLFNITGSAGYEMDMHVENGLPCIAARIHPHIEPRYAVVLSSNQTSLLSEHGVYGVQFGLIKVEVIGDMAFRNYQRVQWRNRKSVSDRHA